jgi:DnaA family protein
VEQLVFELAAPEPPCLANFLPGRNEELLAVLPAFIAGQHNATGMLLWGAPASGKSHLLAAAVVLAKERGLVARHFAHPRDVADDAVAADALIAIDRVDEADATAAGRMFTLFNALQQRNGRMIAASRVPLANLPLREDLRTRLGWGLVYEVVALADEDKSMALRVYAKDRGLALSGDVVDYLLHHGRRDMRSLLATLAALDRRSLAAKRPITVPMIKDWLRQDSEWERRGNG